jgi:hypothetical protein
MIDLLMLFVWVVDISRANYFFGGVVLIFEEGVPGCYKFWEDLLYVECLGFSTILIMAEAAEFDLKFWGGSLVYDLFLDNSSVCYLGLEGLLTLISCNFYCFGF